MLIDREFSTPYIDAVHFFKILIFASFQLITIYIMSISDFQPTFLHKFKLNQGATDTARQIN